MVLKVQDRRLELPVSYHKSDAAYPALYTTDANRSFLIYSMMSLVH